MSLKVYFIHKKINVYSYFLYFIYLFTETKPISNNGEIYTYSLAEE